MILKGGPRAKAAELATHLLRTDTNETVRLLGCNGTAAQDMRGSLLEMEAVAAGGRTGKPLYHISISPEADERLTDAQWILAAERLEKGLDMADHQRVMVLHTKNGRRHAHIVWNRVDTETLKTAHHSHNYRTHEQVARALEREFGLKRTQGRHAEVEGERKEKKRPNTRESQQAARTGWSADQARADIHAAWEQSDSGAGFRAHLLDNGYQLARGDRRDVVILDPGCGIHSVARRAGVKVAEVRARLADLDLRQLPDVEQAKALIVAARAQRETARSSTRAPELARYEALEPAPMHSVQFRHSQTYFPVAPAKVPAPEPKPPTWALIPPAVPERKPVVQPAPARPTRPVAAPVMPSPPPAPNSPEAALAARREALWQQTAGQIEDHYRRAASELDAHHARRMFELTGDIDRRLKELNGIASRVGALTDPAARNREIAYLVAVRQRKLAEEKARQEKVKAGLQTAKEKELAEAKAKHDSLSALQQGASARQPAPERKDGRSPSR